MPEKDPIQLPKYPEQIPFNMLATAVLELQEKFEALASRVAALEEKLKA